MPDSEHEGRPVPVGRTAEPDPQDPEALLLALEAERASSERLRLTAEQRRAALDELGQRPVVRVALALERRSQRLTDKAMALTGRVRLGAGRARLAMAAAPRRATLGRRSHELWAAIDALPPAPRSSRSVSLVVLSDDPSFEPPVADDALVSEVLRSLPGEEATSAAARGVAAAAGELVCLLTPTSEPLAGDWLARLAAAIVDDVVAAAPLLVHPARPLSQATPHDLLVRTEGLEMTVARSGVPGVRARRAGSDPAPGRPAQDVDAGSAAAVLLDRRACAAIGGLRPLGDLESSAVELCARLRQAGGRVVSVPGAVMLDHRPVRTPAELVAPIDHRSRGWQAAIDQRGPTLLRMAKPSPGTGLAMAVTVASPSAKVAKIWGDWHLAAALGRSLERLGHSVRLQTADESDHPAGRCADVHIAIRGLVPVRRTPGQRHVLWIISHPEAIDPRECDEADLVLVASRRFAEDLRTRTNTPVEVVLQATDPRRFRPMTPDPSHRHPITVVAKTRDVLRPAVTDALAAGLRPSIYGSGWEGFVDPDLIVANHVPNELLPVVYSSAGVVLNDHWDTMRAWGFVSNRLFDVLACGTPIISDHLPEIVEVFGDTVPTYRDPEELASLVGEALQDPVQARRRADEGRRIVLDRGTFDHRARTLLDLLVRHGLDRPLK